ncbi:arylsulfatase [Foetidibacter luteolus]|uniref:arylsulfatase n=1 Tax=Foetidibacter luteolus TaxID=2608880 RepID=UPI00129C0918|nr:arylsulfatase [Foetidibacter luteolus]
MMQYLKTLLFTAFIACSTIATFAQAGKPNIILIVADDLGYGDLGCYGQQKIHTPHLDGMARQGMRFTRFYAGTSVCAPSRASLLTGLHTGHTSVRGNREMQPEGQFPLAANTPTIAELLKQAGYVTAAFGKWGLGFPGSPATPVKKGFDMFFGYNCQAQAHNYLPDHVWDNDNRVELPGNMHADSVYASDLIHRKTLSFLRQQGSQPFFLFLPYTLPHAALSVPHDSVYNSYVKKFNEQAVPINKAAHYKEDEYPHAAFAAMVTRLDAYVGEIMQAVKNAGLADNTLILFTSDNGPHKEGGADPDFFASSGGLRGIKRDLYEGGIRVPMLAVWNGKIKPNTVNKEPLAAWDLLPAFCELAGQPAPQGIDGISMLPQLTGAVPQLKHEYLYWEFHEGGGRQAVLWGKWKAVKLNVSKMDNPVIELYNLDADPAEQHNVAAQHPEIVSRLNSIIQQAHVYDKEWPLLKTEK